MDLGENEDENDFYGEFNDIVDQNIFGKNETNEDMHHNAYFEKINESEKNKPQTEFSKRPNPKNQMKRKNSLAENSSNILQKKTSRADGPTKKKKKTKNDMDLTLKNKTEIEYDKSERKKLIYEVYNQEEFFDDYPQPAESGDLINILNSDEAIPDTEVNETRQIYRTENNLNVPETFDMILSSNK